MTIQAAKKPNFHKGAEKLQTLAFLSIAFGAVIGSIVAALVQRNRYIEPLHNLGIYISLHCNLFILTMFLDKSAEPEHDVLGFIEAGGEISNSEDSLDMADEDAA